MEGTWFVLGVLTNIQQSIMEGFFMFSELKRHLEPRWFENSENTYYFGKGNKLCLIEQPNGRLTYAAFNEKRKPVIVTELEEYSSVSIEAPFESIFIVPNYKMLKNITKIDNSKMSPFVPACIFEVAHYGLLEDKRFKGTLFEQCWINVAIINSKGEVFEDFMIVGDGVRGMDGNPRGTIYGAYNLVPIVELET